MSPTSPITEIVSAYVGHNTIAGNDLLNLVATVGKELAGLGQAPAEPEDEKSKPAAPIKRSVREDHVTCLICGKPQKILKRHLTTRHELTPDEYRATLGLKDDYPLVAPAYTATRSALAKKSASVAGRSLNNRLRQNAESRPPRRPDRTSRSTRTWPPARLHGRRRPMPVAGGKNGRKRDGHDRTAASRSSSRNDEKPAFRAFMTH